MRDVPLRIGERNDPAVEIAVKKKPAAPGVTPQSYDLSGLSAVEFFRKNDPDDVDGTPLYTMGSGITVQAPATDGRLLIQLRSVDFQTPGIFWYKVDIVRAGLRLTVGKGPLIVENS